jgi:hypothetical protein
MYKWAVRAGEHRGKPAIEAFLRRDESGTVVYENRAIVFGRIVWGKIVYHEDFEDTQKAEAFDAYLARRASNIS